MLLQLSQSSKRADSPENFHRCLGRVPNIQGEFRSFDIGSVESPLGAFYISSEREKTGSVGGQLGTDIVVGMQASRSNSSYNGTKLQPKSLQILPCIRT